MPSTANPPGAPPDLDELVERIGRDRDRDAFATLFRSFAPYLKGYLRSLGCSESVADEVLQDALLNVWRRAGSFDRDRASAKTWIVRIARNRCIDRFRRRQTAANVTDALRGIAALEPAHARFDGDMVRRTFARDVVRRAVQSLPAEQSSVLWKAYAEGYSAGAIAEEIGVPVGTVKSRIRLAVRRLRQEVGE